MGSNIKTFLSFFLLLSLTHHSKVQKTAQDFYDQVWEKAPKYFPATQERKAFIQSTQFQEDYAFSSNNSGKRGPRLVLGRDVVAAKYVGGVRHTMNDAGAEDEAVVKVDPSKLLREGWTLQIHQPQRFNDDLWRLCSALEGSLGCLVGCNQYVTPPSKQGLAPHYDDVEIFVVQIKGEKKWKLYEKKEYMLANAPSGDLLEASLGKPSMEVTLCPGDCLYMPRGTVHHATALSLSSHVTISTYQRWTVLDVAHQLLGTALESPETQLKLPLPLKRSLEPRLLSTLSLDPKLKTLTSSVATALTHFAQYIENNKAVFNNLADALVEDYMANRLPPHPAQLPFASSVPLSFTVDDILVARAPSFFLVMPLITTSGSGPICRVLSCLGNSRESHMLQESDEHSSEEEEEEDDEKNGIFVTTHFRAIEQLLIRREQVRISDLDVSLPEPLLSPKAQVQLQFARELLEFGAVMVHQNATKELEKGKSQRKKSRLKL